QALGRIRGRVETRVDVLPTKSAVPLAEAETPVRARRRLVDSSRNAVAEIVVDVLLGREVRAPRRLTGCAVAERAERNGLRVSARIQQGMHARGACDLDRRVCRDAPVVSRA